MRESLFRKEAAEGLKPRLEGQVIALTALSPRLITWSAVCAVAVALGFASMAEYSKFEAASGHIAPRAGLLQVLAPMDGELTRLAVKEGDLVKQGQTLAVVERLQAAGDGQSTAQERQLLAKQRANLSNESAESKRQLLLKQAESARDRGVSLESAVQAAVAAEVSSARARDIAAQQLERTSELARQGFLAATAQEQAQQGLADREAALAQARQETGLRRASLQEARSIADRTELELRLLASNTRSEVAQADDDALELNAGAQAAMVAAHEGRIVAVATEHGQIRAGQPVLVLAPSGALYAHLVLAEPVAARVKPGLPVLVRLQGQSLVDAQRFEGILEHVSEGVVTQGSVTGHLARVRFPEGTELLKPGSRVQARIRTETHSLLGWLFEPLRKGLADVEVSAGGSAPSAPSSTSPASGAQL